jgi:hypothetical protein
VVTKISVYLVIPIESWYLGEVLTTPRGGKQEVSKNIRHGPILRHMLRVESNGGLS